MKSGDIPKESAENGIDKPHKKSALRMLRRHLTKVNPLPQSTLQPAFAKISTNGYIGESIPLPSTTDAFRSKIINTNHHIVSDNSPSKIHRNYLVNNNTNTKISHQIGLCCSVDDRAGTPIEKISVKYKSLPDIQLRNSSIKPLVNTTIAQPISTDNDHTPADHTNDENSHCPISASTLDISKHSSNSNHSSKHREVAENNWQNSIAVSACRSRFRQQILTGSAETSNDNNLQTDQRKESFDGDVSNAQASIEHSRSVPVVHEKMNATHRPSVTSTDKTKKRSVNLSIFS